MKTLRNIFFAAAVFLHVENRSEGQTVQNSLANAEIELIVMDVNLHDDLQKEIEDFLQEKNSVPLQKDFSIVIKQGPDSIAACQFFDNLAQKPEAHLFSQASLKLYAAQPCQFNLISERNVPVAVSGTIDPVVSYEEQSVDFNFNFITSINSDQTFDLQTDCTFKIASAKRMTARSFTSNVSVQAGDLIVLGEGLDQAAALHRCFTTIAANRKMFVVVRVVSVNSDIENDTI